MAPPGVEEVGEGETGVQDGGSRGGRGGGMEAGRGREWEERGKAW